ncbi:hypothetical protein COCNU_08G003720 [Cocos nucifera]|uniref:VWFA domain-containing protein n=1 Tax=Cocos nucifera TaxID=13894 RepID=A0A8K0IIQ2_COCNU|nr:hypothetical protein COCNU_08G003720 [Cocos nucifera]
MGLRSSKEASSRSFRSTGSFQDRSYSQEQYWGQSYPYEAPGYQNYPPPPQSYGEPVQAYPPPSSGYSQPSRTQRAGGSRPRLDRRYSKITDDYSSVEQVTEALAQAGLESSNLIVGIDFTKSNEWTGKFSFHGRSLHHVGDIPNPYEQAISIIGRTLSAFDEDNLIPCFGFGDASTHDQDVFSFYPDERPCNGFSEALARYRELIPHLRLAGPTSFAPIIEMAMTIVEQNGGQYHVLLIIADGQVTRSVDTEYGQLSAQEQKTIDAIVKASEFPLSIVLVGVGDGPWDMMKQFDDNIPARSFDNFQFVNFTEIMSKNMPQTKKEAAFALAALMEIPSQYKATLELGILGTKCSSYCAKCIIGQSVPKELRMEREKNGKPVCSKSVVGGATGRAVVRGGFWKKNSEQRIIRGGSNESFMSAFYFLGYKKTQLMKQRSPKSRHQWMKANANAVEGLLQRRAWLKSDAVDFM